MTRRALTVIEVLVVIAIIAILAAIHLPGGSRKPLAWWCLSNQRQIAIAAVDYASDSKDRSSRN